MNNSNEYNSEHIYNEIYNQDEFEIYTEPLSSRPTTISSPINIPGSYSPTPPHYTNQQHNYTNQQHNNVKNKEIRVLCELENINDECMICLEDINLGKESINIDTIVLDCKHAYHYQCFLQWIVDSYQVFFHKIKCPLCNQKVGIKSIYYPTLRKKHYHTIDNIYNTNTN